MKNVHFNRMIHHSDQRDHRSHSKYSRANGIIQNLSILLVQLRIKLWKQMDHICEFVFYRDFGMYRSCLLRRSDFDALALDRCQKWCMHSFLTIFLTSFCQRKKSWWSWRVSDPILHNCVLDVMLRSEILLWNSPLRVLLKRLENACNSRHLLSQQEQ